jgi:hypothetical protein
MSEVMAARNGRRGTRSARLLWLGARAGARAIRWAWLPGAHVDANDRRTLRGLHTAFGALIGVTVLLTVATVRTSGWRRLPWAETALLFGLFTTRMITVGIVVGTVVRAVKGGQHR